jgi:hypothetical protein
MAFQDGGWLRTLKLHSKLGFQRHTSRNRPLQRLGLLLLLHDLSLHHLRLPPSVPLLVVSLPSFSSVTPA